ncbi:hypothetical protein COX86_03025 [Candidatus Micrarchaeota archaeon CG_4_10_14_0_2_um_filter_60_11]|nr:MAG: hypothetical protein AUJ16_00950 [Candidatus Micrarchaeota archaeon CG1_02_60_51]PIN96098.1 MAG: hypothetical protein COU39_02780 [Candidatus Micrarchaeota archaeon CG10_big_fil_rev_8_21_14_0_10_60_32]PIO01604.1 MAG: hypothetical protein COT58_04400 [Candidatus Micrarchaeota archaeon CG09_land_8_20_14_0_10_60_16]PIY91733.1 MAG: hypothetical protein COY71_01695 [Candidatus Micrarchaeota archaeon CG_4_10_14_0_8_um_filter_60_7]PIZ90816.1 MAG: hypothetical protein COX86_03025 [Candidatus Mi
MIGTLFKVLTKPTETFAEQKANSSYLGVFKNLALLGLAVTILGAAIATVASSFMSLTGMQNTPLSGIAAAGAFAAGLLFAIVFVGTSVAFFISNAIQFAVARMLKGQGTFKQQAYLSSLVVGVQALALLAITAIAGATLLFNQSFLTIAVALIVAVIVGLYSLYLNYRALSEAHGTDTLATIGIMILPGLVMYMLQILLALVVFVLRR